MEAIRDFKVYSWLHLIPITLWTQMALTHLHLQYSNWDVDVLYFGTRSLIKVLGWITNFTYQEMNLFYPISNVSRYFFSGNGTCTV